MSLDPFREVRDAVRPHAAAGQLTDMRATQIAMRHRVVEADVRRIYAEEHARLHPETAEPDTAVQASAPPAVTEDEPTPPADPPGRIDIQFPMTPDAVHEVAGIMAQLDAPHDVAPLTDDEQAQASDMALVSDAILAMTMVGDQIPDVLRVQHGLALNHVMALHTALRDHHRNADLIAERAVLAARLAEIDAALGYDDQANDDQPPPQPEVGGGRVNCPKCGIEIPDDLVQRSIGRASNLSSATASAVQRKGRPRLSDETLTEVFEVYTAAEDRARLTAVRKHFGITQSKAQNWVAASRKRLPQLWEGSR